MRALVATILTAAVCSLFVGCADSTPPAGAAEIINTHCPIMGGEVNPETTVDYDGKKVAFCCPPCLDEWASMSEEERKEALEKAADGKGHEGHEGHAGHETHSDAGEETEGGEEAESGDDTDPSEESAAGEESADKETETSTEETETSTEETETSAEETEAE